MAQQEVLTFKGIADCLQKERGYLHAYVSITKAKEAFLSKKTETNGSNWVIRTTLSSIVCSKTGRLRALYYSCGMLMVRRWPGGRWVVLVNLIQSVQLPLKTPSLHLTLHHICLCITNSSTIHQKTWSTTAHQ